MKNSTFRPGDFVIFTLVLLLAAAIASPFVFASAGAQTVEIWQEQTMVKKVKMAEGYRETIPLTGRNGQNIIEIDGTRVRVTSADCYDQVCVRTGWLSRAGQAAVCLPNRVIVKITGADAPDGVDAIVQ